MTSADSGSADTPCSWRFAFSEHLGASGKHLGPSLNVGDVVFTATAGWLAKHTIQFEPDFSYGGFRYSLLTFACDESASDIAAGDVAAAVNPAIGPGMIVSHFTHTDLAKSNFYSSRVSSFRVYSLRVTSHKYNLLTHDVKQIYTHVCG